MKISLEALEDTEKKFPVKPADLEESKARIQASSAMELDGNAFVNKRIDMISSSALENPVDAFERYIGTNDLLPINYLLLGYLKSKSVGRIYYIDKTYNKPAAATGFLITPDLVITNHHVLFDMTMITNPVIQFNYEFGIDGNEEKEVVFRLDPKKYFHSSKELDFAIIGVETLDQTRMKNISEFGYLPLNGNLGKAGIGDFITIIQHPEGSWKQISMRENKILSKDDPTMLLYECDTSKGTSGSPGFNDQWQIIAMHSTGVAKKDADGDYIDSENKKILPVNGAIDASRIIWTSNAGIRVSSIVGYLTNSKERYNRYIVRLFEKTYTDSRELVSLSFPNLPGSGLQPTNAANELSLATSQNKPVAQPPITINISLNGGPGLPNDYAVTVSKEQGAAQRELQNAIDEERSVKDMDYSDRAGFNEHFLDRKISMPKLNASLIKKTARLLANNKEFTIRYANFSTIQHAVRKQPIVSAVNVDGSKKIKEATGGSISWIKDNRLSLDEQLSNPWYSGSGFDKGHMSRREDAEWGEDLEEAQFRSRDTFHLTNCCPQVPALNQSKRQGLWGKLEIEILENGARDEEYNQKICVFNGPIFKDGDPVYRGIQVPMVFWKIVLWKNKKGKLLATAFKLSQEDLVDDIAFEEILFNQIMVEHQCSIAWIEKQTELTFAELRAIDTYQGNERGYEKITLESFENRVLEMAELE
jgi:endonuclease G